MSAVDFVVGCVSGVCGAIGCSNSNWDRLVTRRSKRERRMKSSFVCWPTRTKDETERGGKKANNEQEVVVVVVVKSFRGRMLGCSRKIA